MKLKNVKKKKVVVVSKTVDMTVKDFCKSIGLHRDPVGYVAAAAVLRMLVKKGIAKEVARLHLGDDRLGRKTLIYRLPVRLTLNTVKTNAA